MASVPTLISALGDYGFSDSTNAEKVRALQGSIWAIERVRPWPFLESSASLTFSGSSNQPVTPPAQLRTILRARDTAVGRKITPIRLDDLEDNLGAAASDTAVGSPQHYYVEAGLIKFWPVPPASTTVKLRFLQWSAAIDETSAESAILIPPRHFEAIMFGALMRLMDKEDDPELASRFEAQFGRALAEMVEDLFKQQFDEPDYVHVLDPSDYI